MKERLKKIFLANKTKTAYVINGESIKYGELCERAEHYASLLKRQGTGPVIVYGHKSVEMLVSMLACVFAGRAYVPVDVGTPEIRIRKIVEVTKSELILENEPLSSSYAAQKVSLAELKMYADKSEHDTEKNDTVYIIFTSGSTGEPKGVPISKGNLLNFVRWISSLEPLRALENARVLNQASFSFDLSVADIYYSLFNAHTLIGLDKAVQEGYSGIFDVIAENGINVMVVTPTFMKMCLLEPTFCAENHPSLRCIYFCGEMLDKKTVKRIFSAFPDIRVINAYGPTEATSAVSGIVIDKAMLEGEGNLPVGETDTAATRISIEDGEIILKGESVFSGYIGGIKGGHYTSGGVNCYKTGDLGYIEGGRLYCTGRRDNQIKLKGYRIELEDIERNISEIDGIKACAVILKTKGSVKLLKAFAVSDGAHTVEYIKSELKKRLPEYMIPKTVTMLEKLPVNENGKTDKRRLGEL